MSDVFVLMLSRRMQRVLATTDMDEGQEVSSASPASRSRSYFFITHSRFWISLPWLCPIPDGIYLHPAQRPISDSVERPLDFDSKQPRQSTVDRPTRVCVLSNR